VPESYRSPDWALAPAKTGLRAEYYIDRSTFYKIQLDYLKEITVCCECCVLSGRGLCDELITRPEDSYRLWCVVVCDLETSRMRRP